MIFYTQCLAIYKPQDASWHVYLDPWEKSTGGMCLQMKSRIQGVIKRFPYDSESLSNTNDLIFQFCPVFTNW